MADASDRDRPVHHPTAYDVKYKKGAQYMADQRARMKARYWMVKKLGEKALVGMDVDHKKALHGGGTNDPSNWRVRSMHANRADKTF